MREEQLTVRLQRLLETARGLPEPKYDRDHTRVTNWDDALQNEVGNIVGAFYASREREELRACARALDDDGGVPRGLIRILERALFDNPDTPTGG